MSSSKPSREFASALAAAIRYTRAHVHSRQEVLQYLKRLGVSDGVGREVVAECADRGLVDDRACARLWAEHWAKLGYAQAAIHQRLTEKALHATAIEHAINLVTRDSDDEARARVVVARHLSRGRPPRSRLARALASRGFDPDVIERVLDKAFDVPSSN